METGPSIFLNIFVSNDIITSNKLDFMTETWSDKTSTTEPIETSPSNHFYHANMGAWDWC